MEDLNHALAVAHQQQRQAHEIHRLHVAVLRQVAGEADAGPVAAQHVVALQLEIALLGIELVGQAVGFVDRSQDGFQGVGRNQAKGSRSHCCSLLLGTKGNARPFGLLHGGEFRQETEQRTNDFFGGINYLFSLIRNSRITLNAARLAHMQ
ncbi:hypothetical protein D3C78_1475150 [compost metagenome]